MNGRVGRGRGAGAAVAALALGTTLAGLALGAWLLPYGSLNRDESTYVEFAQILRGGSVTLDAATHRALRPWASGIVDGRVVMKYTPPWPAVIAAADAVGARRLAPAAAGGVAVLLVYALGRKAAEEGRRRDAGALAAAAAFGLSPFVLVQSATYLSYLFQLDLGMGAALLLLGRSTRSAAAGGFLAGLALFARPFDAVLLLAPFAAVVLVRRRSQPAWLGAAVLGGLPPLALALVYNAAVLGSPFRLPFTVTGSRDAFGFGRRGVFPSVTVAFHLGDGLWAAAQNGGWLVAWAFGGPVLVGLAVLGYRRLPPTDAKRALAAAAVLSAVGYVGFWGSAAVVDHWRGAATLGPFYHLPMLVPLAVFGGHGLAALGRRNATVVAVAAFAVTAAWLPPKITENREVTRRYAAAAAATKAIAGPAVLLAPNRGITGYESWTPFLHNQPDLDQPVLYADDREAGNFALFDRHPGRTPFRLVPVPSARRPSSFRVERLGVEHAARSFGFEVRIGRATGVTAYLADGRGPEQQQPVLAGGTIRWPVVLPAGRASGVLAVGYESVDRRTRVEQRIPWRAAGADQVELLLPGRGFRRTGRTWAPADVAGLLDVDVDAAQGM